MSLKLLELESWNFTYI